MEWERKHEQELVQTQNHNMVERIVTINWSRHANAKFEIVQVNLSFKTFEFESAQIDFPKIWYSQN